MAENMSKLSCINRARAEAESGRYWRAKEILRGNISTVGYNYELYEEYGRLLLSLNEVFEAGKYLFLSGVRNELAKEPIEIYLGRFGSNWENLLGTFPTAARHVQRATYPPVVAAYLESIGAPNRCSADVRDSDKFSLPARAHTADELPEWGCWAGIAIVGIGVVLLFAKFTGGLTNLRSIPWWVWLVVALSPGALFAVKEFKGK